MTETAAAKKPRAPRRRKAEPVVVRTVHPRAIEVAHELARGMDAHVEVRNDGFAYVVNGSR